MIIINMIITLIMLPLINKMAITTVCYSGGGLAEDCRHARREVALPLAS